ncbi:MAG: hypothetical protein ACOZHQ_09500 [Thermodesulfobacteriota bacterium]
MLYVFVDGQCVEQNASPAPPPLEVFRQKYGEGVAVVDIADETPFLGVPRQHLHLVDGAVIVNPAWTPPAPALDPVQVRLEALEAAVARQEQAVAANLLASPHDRRWLAQKERAKLFGIGWIKANPEASMEELEAAVIADLASQFSGEPLVVSGGVILSYAVEAAARGYIPDGSYESLRALVVAADADQIQAMLAAL